MKKIINIIRYIFCIPIAAICALILSVLFSILKVLLNTVYCKIAAAIHYISPHITAVCMDGSEKSFLLADIVFVFSMIYLTELFAPNHKKVFCVIAVFLCFILLSYAIYAHLFINNNSKEAFNEFIVLIGLIIWAVIRFKNNS